MKKKTKKKKSLSVFFEGAFISHVTKARLMKKQSLSVYFLREQLFKYVLKIVGLNNYLNIAHMFTIN